MAHPQASATEHRRFGQPAPSRCPYAARVDALCTLRKPLNHRAHHASERNRCSKSCGVVEQADATTTSTRRNTVTPVEPSSGKAVDRPKTGAADTISDAERGPAALRPVLHPARRAADPAEVRAQGGRAAAHGGHGAEHRLEGGPAGADEGRDGQRTGRLPASLRHRRAPTGNQHERISDLALFPGETGDAR
jgi:hypothetical protein